MSKNDKALRQYNCKKSQAARSYYKLVRLGGFAMQHKMAWQCGVVTETVYVEEKED